MTRVKSPTNSYIVNSWGHKEEKLCMYSGYVITSSIAAGGSDSIVVHVSAQNAIKDAFFLFTIIDLTSHSGFLSQRPEKKIIVSWLQLPSIIVVAAAAALLVLVAKSPDGWIPLQEHFVQWHSDGTTTNTCIRISHFRQRPKELHQDWISYHHSAFIAAIVVARSSVFWSL